MSRHLKDSYVKSSRNNGFRARSAYKLIQIIEKFPQIYSTIIADNSYFIDLGAAPGSWSQVLSDLCHSKSKILAIDLLPMEPIKKVQLLNLDLSNQTGVDFLKETITKSFGLNQINLVVSDLCTNLSGNSIVDNSKNFYLWNLVLDSANNHLQPKGHLILKYFESCEANVLKKILENSFDQVVVFKPKASRAESAEKYFVCSYKKPNC